MGMTNSISSFTASLAGTLFGSLEQMHCNTRYVEKQVGSEDEQESEARSAEHEQEGTGSDKVERGDLAPAPWKALDSRVPGENDIEDAEDREDSEDEHNPETAPPTEHAEAPKKSEENGSDLELSEAEQKQVDELKKRDAEVRAHEQAHMASAGGHAQGGPTYEYQAGPDGKRYAVGGSVQLDVFPVPGDPDATIEKAKTIRKAAMAPAQPSSQDRTVAASASAMETQARTEQAEKSKEDPDSPNKAARTDNNSAPSKAAHAERPEPAPGVMGIVAESEPESGLDSEQPENETASSYQREPESGLNAQASDTESGRPAPTPLEQKGLAVYAEAMNQGSTFQPARGTYFSAGA